MSRCPNQLLLSAIKIYLFTYVQYRLVDSKQTTGTPGTVGHLEGETTMRDLILEHVAADSVPYGPQITVKGNKVWVVRDCTGKLLGVYPTAQEARRKHHMTKKPRTPQQEYNNRAQRWGTFAPWAARFRRKHNLDG